MRREIDTAGYAKSGFSPTRRCYVLVADIEHQGNESYDSQMLQVHERHDLALHNSTQQDRPSEEKGRQGQAPALPTLQAGAKGERHDSIQKRVRPRSSIL